MFKAEQDQNAYDKKRDSITVTIRVLLGLMGFYDFVPGDRQESVRFCCAWYKIGIPDKAVR